jgi:DNA-binding MarR family transcriptional regulator
MSQDSNSLKLINGLAKLGMVIRHHLWDANGDLGHSPTQAQILVVLHNRARESGLPVTELSRELAITPATVSDAVVALERRGLVRRDRDSQDARIVRVSLTPEGDNRAYAAALWPDFLLNAVETLDEQERAALLRGLVKMIHSLQQAGRIPVARMCPTCTFFRPHAHPDPARPHHCAFVDAPLGGGDLRLDCPDHRTAPASELSGLWEMFAKGASPSGPARDGDAGTPIARANSPSMPGGAT